MRGKVCGREGNLWRREVGGEAVVRESSGWLLVVERCRRSRVGVRGLKHWKEGGKE